MESQGHRSPKKDRLDQVYYIGTLRGLLSFRKPALWDQLHCFCMPDDAISMLSKQYILTFRSPIQCSVAFLAFFKVSFISQPSYTVGGNAD